MSKQKFKVGDRVRIVEAYPNIHNNELAEVVGPSYGVFGELVCVKLQSGDLWTCIKVEPVKTKHPVIVITADGKTTTATERKGKKVIKTASATCSEKDTFDFSEGARVAFERLQGRDPFPREKKPKYYNGKIVCISSVSPRLFTVGRVYKVVDGMFRADNNNYLGKYSSVGEINRKFSSQFAVFVED